MLSEPITSVSKGVFIYKGEKKHLTAESYIKPLHELDDEKSCTERMAQFKKLSRKIQKEADDIQTDINAQVFDELISYLDDAHKNFVLHNRDDHGTDNQVSFLRRKVMNEIPAAALVMGVNTPDHESMFQNLISMIKSRVTPHIALLKSVKCLNVKSIIAETILQLTGNGDSVDVFEEEEEPEVQTSTKKKTLPTMRLVTNWYHSAYKKFVVDVPSSPPSSTFLLPSTPQKRPAGGGPKSHEDYLAETFTPRKLSIKLKRVTLSSPPPKGCNTSTPTKSAGAVSPSSDHRSPSSPVKSPLASPTRRLTRMSLRSPQKREHQDGDSGIEDVESGKIPKREECSSSRQSLILPRKSGRCKSVVIILEDFEGFHASVLQDFITILSHHLKDLPVVLVFGIATMVSSIHLALPHSVSSLLSIHKFQSIPSSTHLSKVLDQILINQNPIFRVDTKVFDLLLDSFLFNDFSVQNYIRSFKLSMMEHFHSNPASLLCTDENKLNHLLDKLSDKKLDSIRSVHSFRRYVESCSPEEQIKLLKDVSHTKKAIKSLMMILHKYHQHFFPIFRCLHLLVSDLPSYPLGKTSRELYGLCLHRPICESESYNQAKLFIRAFSVNELHSRLSKMIEILGETRSCELEEISIVLQQLIEELKHAQSVANDVVKEMKEEEKKDVLDSKLRTRHEMASVKQTLEEEKRRKTTTQDGLVKQKVVDYLDEIFRKYLLHPRAHVLYECLYFTNADVLRSRVLPAPRSSLQRALNNPHHYLQNEELSLTTGQITPELPDICIAYKLHLECGKLINLYDWLQAFLMVIDSNEDQSDDSSSATCVDKTKQARFVRAVAELQFLGFIKPTRRKTDHVARLTWGAC